MHVTQCLPQSISSPRISVLHQQPSQTTHHGQPQDVPPQIPHVPSQLPPQEPNQPQPMSHPTYISPQTLYTPHQLSQPEHSQAPHQLQHVPPPIPHPPSQTAPVPHQSHQCRPELPTDRFKPAPQAQSPPSSQSLNPIASIFHLQSQPGQDSLKSNHNSITPYVEFMARRELIANKIEKFNDKPENYLVWKESFRNMVRDVHITPREELSLMTEYTTNNTKALVQKLRNAFITNPQAGLMEVWRKLDERYGSTVVLTKAHLDKFSNFPTISYRDNRKLQEFGDLLLGLECAKKDGRLQGLRVLDEPIYLKPVIKKLPGDIPTRWQRHAFRYKNNHAVDFPPFDEFSKFIQDLSLQRNDANLVMEPPQKNVSGLRQTYKAEFENNRNGTTDLDPSKWCILHKKPHPLSKCRAFRSKPIAERKNLLKQHRICYRCVASTNHLAKNCPCTTKCSECQSDRHLSALHAGKPHEEDDPKEENADQGGEHQEVTTKCTELCNVRLGGRSCANICLANVYAKSQPNKKIRAYVVLDDQSNCSLGKSQLFEQLSIHGERSSYTLRTCSGTAVLDGRCTKDLMIESSDGRKVYSLPTVIECNAIPDSKEEIPTPAVAKAYPHFRAIADKNPN